MDNNFLDFFSNVAFPVAVASFCLVKMDTTLKELNNNILKLTLLISQKL